MRKHRTIKSHLCGGLYLFADKLPSSVSRFGPVYKSLRNRIAKGFIASCGNHVNLELHIKFNLALQIGDYSGIGEHSEAYGDVRIGKYVMMGTWEKYTLEITNSQYRYTNVQARLPACQTGYY